MVEAREVVCAPDEIEEAKILTEKYFRGKIGRKEYNEKVYPLLKVDLRKMANIYNPPGRVQILFNNLLKKLS